MKSTRNKDHSTIKTSFCQSQIVSFSLRYIVSFSLRYIDSFSLQYITVYCFFLITVYCFFLIAVYCFFLITIYCFFLITVYCFFLITVRVLKFLIQRFLTKWRMQTVLGHLLYSIYMYNITTTLLIRPLLDSPKSGLNSGILLYSEVAIGNAKQVKIRKTDLDFI